MVVNQVRSCQRQSSSVIVVAEATAVSATSLLAVWWHGLYGCISFYIKQQLCFLPPCFPRFSNTSRGQL